MPTKNKIVLSLGFFLLTIGILFSQEEDLPQFVLPELTPSIEPVETVPLDSPILKKQMFLSETLPLSKSVCEKVTIPGSRFSPFSESSINFAVGNYGFREGKFSYKQEQKESYTSIDYLSNNIPTEITKAAQQSNSFKYIQKNSIGAHWFSNILLMEENKFTAQTKKSISYNADLTLDVGKVLLSNIELFFSYAELKNIFHRESFFPKIKLINQIYISGNYYITAILENFFQRIYTQEKSYDSMLTQFLIDNRFIISPRMSMSLGAENNNNLLFFKCKISYIIPSKSILFVEYNPSVEYPYFNIVYFRDDLTHAIVNPILKPTIKKIALSTGIEYYYTETANIKLATNFSQSQDYLYWAVSTQESYLVPTNSDLKVKHLAANLESNFSIKKLSLRTKLIYQDTFDELSRKIPFTPKLTLEGEVKYTIAEWFLGVNYLFFDERSVSLDSNLRMPSAHIVSTAISKVFSNGIVITLRGNNILGMKYSYQPGYDYSLPIISISWGGKF